MEAFIGFGAFAGFAALFIFLIRLHKKQKEAFARELMQAGFAAVPRFDADISQVLEPMLHPRGRGSEPATNIYRYSGLDYDLYRFDVPGHERNETRFAVVFKRLHLPAFSIMPNLKLPGFLDGLVTKLMATALKDSTFTEVQLPGRPQFQEKYHLFAKDGHLLNKVIPVQVWDRLCALPGSLCLQAEGRVLLILELVPVQKRSANNPRAEMRRMVETADTLCSIFRDSTPQRVAV